MNAGGLAPVATASISVVIPTVGRRSLRAAVNSVLEQEGVQVEVIIVADLPLEDCQCLSYSDQRVHVISTGGGKGAGYARQLGTETGSRQWVAYLDDDDLWSPDKLMRQHLAATDESLAMGSVLVSCQVISQAGTGRSNIAPRRCYDSGSVPDYLFHRRRLSSDRALVHTSTLFLERNLALRVGWKSDLPRHQDWDFVVRCEREPEVRVMQLATPLVKVRVNRDGSISASPDWQASLAWYDAESSDWSVRARSDFLVGQVLRYSLQARSIKGIGAVLRRVVRLRPPTLNALILGCAGAAPRGLMVRTMHSRHGRRGGGA
ncbi:MAG: glycosyltransferase [Acidimicrobiales bacterium]|nr:glycosyltransferase [Acidimicrobiales bacterium]